MSRSPSVEAGAPGDLSTENLKYHLLPGNVFLSPGDLALHNKAFGFWRDFWTGVFKQISGESVRVDDFFRQSIICALTHDSEIAALHLYSFFHLDNLASTAHSYFQINYGTEHLSRLRREGINAVMSMEYLTVNEKFRGSRASVPLAPVLMGLGLRILAESGAESAIAPCRRDLKVDLRAADHGAVPFSEEFIHHGVPVVLMMAPIWNLKQHPDPKVRAAIESLWAAKIDHSNRPLIETSVSRRAA